MRPGSIILTQEGMVFGTPEFMSPEQAQGKALTPSSDIYSLAVILYEVLTGKLPFDAKNPMEYIQLHVTAKPKPINERVPGKTFPPLLWSVLEKALAKKSEDRHASGGEFAHALQAVLQGMHEVPPYQNGQTPRAMMGSVPGAQPMPNPNPPANPAAMAGQQQPTQPNVPAAPHSTPLPQMMAGRRSKQPSIGLLIGVAVAFLVVGAALAALVMKLVMK
jgi:serine/threonine-protein kinase